MRFILNGFPVPAPLKPQVSSKNTDRFILGRLVEVSASFKHANVEGNSKVVVGVTTTRISHDTAWFRSSLRVEIILFVISTEATEDFDDDAAGSGFGDECTRVWLHLWEERRNNSLTTIIHLIARWLGRLRVWTNAIVNRLPRLGTRLSVGIDAFPVVFRSRSAYFSMKLDMTLNSLKSNWKFGLIVPWSAYLAGTSEKHRLSSWC